MEAVLALVGLLLIYREWRHDRERAAWAKEREVLVEAAASVRLGDTPIEHKNRRWDDERSAANYRRRMQERGEYVGVNHE